MSRLVAGIDRIIVFLVGLVLLAVGVWAVALAFNVDIATQLGSWYDHSKLTHFLNGPWYPWALLLIAIATIIVGVWQFKANVSQRRFNAVSPQPEEKNANEGGDAAGTLSVNTTQLAAAAAEAFRTNEDVTKVTSSTRYDRARPTINWTIHAQPALNVDNLVQQIEANDADLAAALPGVDVDTRYFIELDAVKAK